MRFLLLAAASGSISCSMEGPCDGPIAALPIGVAQPAFAPTPELEAATVTFSETSVTVEYEVARGAHWVVTYAIDHP